MQSPRAIASCKEELAASLASEPTQRTTEDQPAAPDTDRVARCSRTKHWVSNNATRPIKRSKRLKEQALERILHQNVRRAPLKSANNLKEMLTRNQIHISKRVMQSSMLHRANQKTLRMHRSRLYSLTGSCSSKVSYLSRRCCRTWLQTMPVGKQLATATFRTTFRLP